jgi:hypothetical protein
MECGFADRVLCVLRDIFEMKAFRTLLGRLLRPSGLRPGIAARAQVVQDQIGRRRRGNLFDPTLG